MHPLRALASLFASIIVLCAWPRPPLRTCPSEPVPPTPQTKKKPPKPAQANSEGASRAHALHARRPGRRRHPRHSGRAGLGRFEATISSACCRRSNGPWLALVGRRRRRRLRRGPADRLVAVRQPARIRGRHRLSIGALIAPYAFLGPRYDEELRKNFTEITAADVFEDKATPESLLDTWPLKRLIEKRVTAEMLAAIAAEHSKGRRLLVATTNLDAGRRVIWNMGAIAARGDEKALKLFRDILLASSSIPGFFPPVAIEVEANGKKFQEMHLDGTITAPFFVAPESMLGAEQTRGCRRTRSM